MKLGAKATYEWIVEGAVVNYDIHGESTGQVFPRIQKRTPRLEVIKVNSLQPSMESTGGFFGTAKSSR